MLADDATLLSLDDFERAAEALLDKGVFDFIAGGAHDERTLRRNRWALDALTFNPRYLRDVSRRDLSTTVLGDPISMPVFISPAGEQQRVHPDGERATARGAGLARTLMVTPSASPETLPGTLAETDGPAWVQVYHRDRDLTERIVRAAEEAGAHAICLTCDAPLPQPKERDLRNGFLVLEGGERATVVLQVTMSDVEWLRARTELPIVLKGLNSPADARLAAEAGVDGVVVSTHGGRLLDSTLGAIEYLPGVVEAVGDRLEVYLDSGIRRGGDVLKALALGARAVGVGRPFFWALAVAGADGAHQMLEILRRELDVTMAFCGQTSVRALDAELVNIPAGWGRSCRRGA